MHHMWFWVGLCPRPRWGSLQSFSRSHSWILGALLLGEGKEKKKKGTPRSGWHPSCSKSGKIPCITLDLGVTWDFEIQLTWNFFNSLSNLAYTRYSIYAVARKKTGNEKHVYFHKTWGRLRRERLSYLNMYLLYIFSYHFLKEFSRSLRTLNCVLSST